MRSSLTVAVVLLFSAAVFAQHSGGSSGGSSGGGGSHGGSSGGSISSSASSGIHSSGGASGSSSHSSNSSGLSSHSKSGTSPTQSMHGANGSGLNIRGPHSEAAKTVQPGKRGFFSILRHPFRKGEPKPVANLRHSICLRGPCPVCPAGQMSNGLGGCGVGFIRRNAVTGCSHQKLWVGGGCLANTSFVDRCSGLRTALNQQAARMQSAESARQAACTNSATQECTELTIRFQSEASLYQAFQQRYQQCRQGSMSSNLGGRIQRNGP